MTNDQEDGLARRSGVPRRRLGFGPWSVEVRGEELAEVTYGGVVLVRAIRPVVRDRDWNTAPGRVDEVIESPDGITAEMRFEDGTVGFAGTLRLRCRAGDLKVQLDLTATRESAANRVGLVVLHPPSVTGSAVTARHSNGSAETAVWPTDISPHQPFRDVVGFSWQQNGLTVDLDLTGDVFETEDQRNWTDASFKTYSTPLERPFPVVYRIGDRVRQSATVSVSGTAHAVVEADPDTIVITDEIVGKIPAIDTLAALFPTPGSQLSLGKRRFGSIVVELAGDPTDWPGYLEVATAQAEELGCGLDVRLVTDDPELVTATLARLPSTTIRASVFDPVNHLTTAPLWAALQQAVRRTAIEPVAGTRAHFTELNRGIADLPTDAPAYTFSLTPQMHAFEVDHIVESLAMQRLVVANTVRLTGGRPLHVGPVTLARRFNAVATSGASSPAENARNATDPLLHTDFAAAWTLGSVAALSRPEVASVCYFEAAGPRGLVDDHGLAPVGRLLDQIAGWRGRPLLRVESRDDLAVLAVGGDRSTIMVGNLTPGARTLQIRISDGTEHTMQLDAWAVRQL